MKNFTISAFADEYDRNLDEQLFVLKSNGVGYLEPRFIGDKNVADLTDEEAYSVKEKLDKNGIKVFSVGSPIGKISLDEEEKHFCICNRVFKTAKILGAKYVRVFSFYIPEGKTRESVREKVFSLMEKTLDLADEYGLTLCHENEAAIYGESPENCLELLNRFGGRLKAVFDGGNFVLGGFDPLKAYETLKNHIEYFHVKDAFSYGAIVPPSKGEAKLKETFERFYSDFDHGTVVTLEPHLETFDGLNSLTDKTFENPYKFKDKKQAFLTALELLKEML